MAAVMTTTTQDLGDSRVRVEVEVSPEALERELDRAAGRLASDMRVPGFRQGKVPTPVVIQRVGREAVLDEAVREALPAWYEEAIGDAHLHTVGDPKVDLADLPERGAPLAFSIEVGVRPTATLGEYRGLEVPKREPEVPEADVDAELERLRDSAASLENVERPAETGDFVVLDFVGSIEGEPFEGGDARGFLLELGSGRLVAGFEDQLVGAAPGEDRELQVTFPEDYQVEHLAGRDVVFATTTREVKEKRLPELDDDFAAESGGFDTLDELRADVRQRLELAQSGAIEQEFREAALDAAVERATVDLPSELVHAKAHEMWENTARRLRAQGLDPQRYLEFAGKDEEELIHEGEPEADRSLRREAVLAAIVETEGLGATDEEALETLRRAASGEGKPPSEKKLQRNLEKAKAEGRDVALREDIAMRKAVDLVVESAVPVSPETAAARDALWTPGQEAEEGAGGGQIWTPGS
jgi:trigger factor